ncbi:MAG: pyridoxal 5'-phosphate synthase glutaminase subunit PdxT [Fimbriimonadaceae bacterium]
MGAISGVLGVQGDFRMHLNALREVGAEPIEVRHTAHLDQVDRLIIPGGESSTVGILLERHGLGEALKRRIQAGMPVWGTCMGMILLAKEIEGMEQYSLGVLDVQVKRNAFGAQVHSFECELAMTLFEEPMQGIFIRAPVVTKVGEGVEVLAELDGKIVAVRQGSVVGTSFHPELTKDRRFHQWFLDLG